MAPRPKRKINVLPNPWCAVDQYGRPCGVCAVDPDLFWSEQYIGAKCHAEVERLPDVLKRIDGVQDTTWEFTTEPISVAFEGAQRAQIQRKLARRELLPADRESAEAAGVPFVEYPRALEAEKAKARDLFDARNGRGAFDALQPVTETTPADKPASKTKG